MGKFARDKEVQKLVDAATEQGWEVKRGKNNHILFYPPKSEKIISIASTGSDYRGKKNGISRLKRAGLDLNKPRPNE